MSEGSERPRNTGIQLPALVSAGALWLLFFRMESTRGFASRFGGPSHTVHTVDTPLQGFLHIAPGEHLFWISHLALALPAAVLTGWALAPGFARLRQWVKGLVDADAARFRRVLFGYGALLLVLAIAVNTLVLLGGPITDDENALRFGAQIWLQGGLSAPHLQPAEAFDLPFMFVDGDRISSMDFPGSIAVTALALGSHLGAWLYALMAAATGVLVVAASEQLFGRRAALFVMLFWAVCPAVFWLSATTHNHVASRLGVAAALYFLARLESGSGGSRDFFGLGLVTGLAFTVRPAETGTLLGPFGVMWALRALLSKDPAARRGIGMALLGLAGPLLAFAAYNAAITGDPLVQARFVPDKIDVTEIPALSAWDRLGVHLAFNLTVLTVFAGGPIAIGLWLAGIVRCGQDHAHATFLKVLLLSVAAQLCLGTLHDDVGIHIVGPIHESDALPALALLAAAGWAFLDAKVDDAITRARLFGVHLGVAVLGYGVFAWAHGGNMFEASLVRDSPIEALDAADVHNAIIVGHTRGIYFAAQTDSVGSWVIHSPFPQPDGSGDRIFVVPDADLKAVRARFPDRRVVNLWMDNETRLWLTRDLDAGAP